MIVMTRIHNNNRTDSTYTKKNNKIENNSTTNRLSQAKARKSSWKDSPRHGFAMPAVAHVAMHWGMYSERGLLYTKSFGSPSELWPSRRAEEFSRGKGITRARGRLGEDLTAWLQGSRVESRSRYGSRRFRWKQRRPSCHDTAPRFPKREMERGDDRCLHGLHALASPAPAGLRLARHAGQRESAWSSAAKDPQRFRTLPIVLARFEVRIGLGGLSLEAGIWARRSGGRGTLLEH